MCMGGIFFPVKLEFLIFAFKSRRVKKCKVEFRLPSSSHRVCYYIFILLCLAPMFITPRIIQCTVNASSPVFLLSATEAFYPQLSFSLQNSSYVHTLCYKKISMHKNTLFQAHPLNPSQQDTYRSLCTCQSV